jgi:SAM-dependent methyltransferase
VRGWQRFFRREAPSYLENVFTKDTQAEVDFIEEELRIRPGARVLDVGCGVGRHSVELARRGYLVVGIDLSDDMIELARDAAEAAGVAEHARFIQGDAASTSADGTFDAAICLCEGAFSLLDAGADSDAHHRGILSNIRRSLEPGNRRFLLTALSALRMIRQFTDEDVAAGRFDPVTTTETTTYEDDAGGSFTLREKGFMPAELVAVLEDCGFIVDHLWGGTAGSWNRSPLRLDEIEVMTVCSVR